MTNGTGPASGYPSEDDCRLADLIDLVSEKTDVADYPCASAVEQNVLIYDGARLRQELSRPAGRPRVETELARALLDGPGIVVLAGAFGDVSVVDRATRQFEAIIAGQRAAGGAAGDHFAQSGQNDRIWNALEKLALRAPEVFAAYYANDLIAAACRAWLGPGYQVTSQVNVVNPGGAAQSVHRDYHLGFASDAQAAQFPRHAHQLSPVLSLQGAVAQGRRCVLQPGPVPRRGHQPHRRCQPDGQPAAGVVGVRPSHGGRRPERDVGGRVPGAAGHGRRRGAALDDRQRHRGVRGRLLVPHEPRP